MDAHCAKDAMASKSNMASANERWAVQGRGYAGQQVLLGLGLVVLARCTRRREIASGIAGSLVFHRGPPSVASLLVLPLLKRLVAVNAVVKRPDRWLCRKGMYS